MARRSDHTRVELRALILGAACRIIADDGLRGLTIRKISTEIGYTTGTLYQVFRNLNELIVETHILTLTALYDDLITIDMDPDPETALTALADRYLRFASANRNRWAALFTHALPDGQALPEHYAAIVLDLFKLGAKALQPIFPEENSEQALLESRVLWSSLYGIASLETTSKLSRFELAETFTRTLFENYVAGLRTRYGTPDGPDDPA